MSLKIIAYIQKRKELHIVACIYYINRSVDAKRKIHETETKSTLYR